MQSKKSQAGIIIIILILIIIITAIILFIVFGSKNQIFSKKNKEIIKIPTLTINARVIDPFGQFARVNYYIEADGIEIKRGIIEPVWNQFQNMPVNRTYMFCFWSDKYYRQCEIYARSNSYKITNKIGGNITVANMTMDGQLYDDNIKGKVEITSPEKLKKGEEQALKFNVSVRNGTIKRLGLCTWHSIGIIYLFNPKTEVQCPYWTNYTFDAEGNRINLTNNYYWCESKKQLEKCNKVIHQSRCEIPNMEIPPRLKGKADSCFYTGINLQNSDYLAEYDIKTMGFINELDYVQLYVIDKELGKNGIYDFYDTDNEGKDTGIPDAIFQLNYTQ